MKPVLSFDPSDSICVLGIPLDKNSSYMKGPLLAPQSIRKSYFSSSSNLWTETGLDLGSIEQLYDLGDLDFGTKEDDFSHITISVKKILEAGNQLICLGGDHSISFPIIEAYAKFYDQLNILHLDAHPDLYDSLDGNSHSHASPFARIMEKKLAVRLVQAGIRTMNGHQREQANKFFVEVHEIKNDFDWSTTLEFDGPVYISLDMDCLDPAFAPGVSHHEPGGMTTRRVLDIIGQFKGHVIGADIVEYNPQRDINSMTSMVAAKFLKEMIARIYRDNKRDKK
ncbi:MAG: agmatinase [Desulfobacula sp.]|nr:agmatinase [Desulfobacula sp.]